ncbi:MAG: RNA-binding protein [bacterium]|nr:RNA-binding protein [bacterium]
MATKLYIGNLSYDTNEDALKELFSQAGSVASASVILDKMTGRSRGFGFVEMADDESAAKAVETFNGYELDGRKLVVNEARPMSDRPRTGGDRGGFRGGNRGGGFGGGGFGGGGDRY